MSKKPYQENLTELFSECPECGEYFPSEGNLNRHVANKHGVSLSSEES